jgi:hypothetical protein
VAGHLHGDLNNEWLIERLGHPTPREAFIEATTAKAA